MSSRLHTAATSAMLSNEQQEVVPIVHDTFYFDQEILKSLFVEAEEVGVNLKMKLFIQRMAQDQCFGRPL